MEEEYYNDTVGNFLLDEINFTWGKKILMAFEWTLLEILGNGLIFGMIQFVCARVIQEFTDFQQNLVQTQSVPVCFLIIPYS